MCGSFKIAIELKVKLSRPLLAEISGLLRRILISRSGKWTRESSEAGEIPRAAERISDGRSCIFPGCDSDARRFSLAASRERRHLRVGSARYRRNQDALVGTISVDGYNIIGFGIGGSEEGNGRGREPLAPSGLFFIKGGSLPSTAKFDGSYVGQKGNRGAPLQNSELFIHPSPYDHIFPLTSFSLVFLFPVSGPEEREDTSIVVTDTCRSFSLVQFIEV